MKDKWRQRFMQLADHVSTWSKDPDAQVGSVIVDSYRRVVGLGFNGFPRGVSDEPIRFTDKMTKLSMIVHAEANAILNANSSVHNCDLFCTRAPCTECTKLIIQSGITTVCAPVPTKPGRWLDDWQYAQQMLKEASVELIDPGPEWNFQ